MTSTRLNFYQTIFIFVFFCSFSKGPADVTASGRHGNSDDISTSFTTRIDSSLREFHEQLLDDPEIEEVDLMS